MLSSGAEDPFPPQALSAAHLVLSDLQFKRNVPASDTADHVGKSLLRPAAAVDISGKHIAGMCLPQPRKAVALELIFPYSHERFAGAAGAGASD